MESGSSLRRNIGAACKFDMSVVLFKELRTKIKQNVHSIVAFLAEKQYMSSSFGMVLRDGWHRVLYA